MNGKQLKALFADVPDHQEVDLWLQDSTGTGGLAAGDPFVSPEMGTNASFVIPIPDGYFLSNTPPK